MSFYHLTMLMVTILALSWGLTFVIKRFALSQNIIDRPNERSSHQQPTPRGGGLGFVFIFLTTLFCLIFAGNNFWQYASFFAAGLLVAGIGFADDLSHISAKWRLLFHGVAAIFILYGIKGMPALGFLAWVLPKGMLADCFAVFFLVWMINLYNFMDGIDGLAAIEAISVCVAGALLAVLSGHPTLCFLPLLLAAAVSGFLYWNFPPACIFMGDCASGFLGLLLGVFALQAAMVNSGLFWAWLIMLGVFIVDATGTLFVRFVKGLKLTEAHCTHAYQKAGRRHGHLRISLSVLFINLFWLLPIAFLVVKGYIDGFWGSLIAYLPLMVLLYQFEAGKKSHSLVENKIKRSYG